MTHPSGLTGEAAAVADRIRAVDHHLDDLERRTQDSVINGLHNSYGAAAANLQQKAAEKEHARLMAERADLVLQLKQLVR